MRTCKILVVVLVCLLAVGAAAAQGNKADDAGWPHWRGPDANGMARGDAPLNWSDTQNVKWKTAIPGRGFSTPVVWGDRIFLTTAIPTGKEPEPKPPVVEPPAPAAPTAGQAPAGRGGRGRPFGDTGPQREHRFEVLCVSRSTGKVLWQVTAKVATPHEGYHSQYGSFASNSPVTDGKHVYAFFGSRGLYCYDMDGKLLWEKDLGPMRIFNQFGEGAPFVLNGERLLIKYDHDAGSFMTALDKNTGKEIWRVERDERTSWSGPLVVDQDGRKQIIVSASKKTRGYDFASGKELWECVGLGANVIPDPVFKNGIVYVMSGYRNPNLQAIRLGKDGDLTGTDAIIWSSIRGTSYTPSPVLFDDKLYVLSDNGMMSCYNAVTGEAFYQQARLSKPYNFKASPVGANGKIYLATENDDVVVIKMGPQLEVLATNTMPDQVFIASPVIVGGEIFLRSQNQLFCISESAK